MLEMYYRINCEPIEVWSVILPVQTVQIHVATHTHNPPHKFPPGILAIQRKALRKQGRKCFIESMFVFCLTDLCY